MKKKSDTTFVAGTEMKSTDVAYLTPIALVVLSIIFFIVDKILTGFILFLIAAFLMTVIWLRSRKGRKVCS